VAVTATVSSAAASTRHWRERRRLDLCRIPGDGHYEEERKAKSTTGTLSVFAEAGMQLGVRLGLGTRASYSNHVIMLRSKSSALSLCFRFMYLLCDRDRRRDGDPKRLPAFLQLQIPTHMSTSGDGDRTASAVNHTYSSHGDGRLLLTFPTDMTTFNSYHQYGERTPHKGP
jgi:hypothetical protein